VTEEGRYIIVLLVVLYRCHWLWCSCHHVILERQHFRVCIGVTLTPHLQSMQNGNILGILCSSSKYCWPFIWYNCLLVKCSPLWFGITLTLVLGYFESVTVLGCHCATDVSYATAWFVKMVLHEYHNCMCDAMCMSEYMY